MFFFLVCVSRDIVYWKRIVLQIENIFIEFSHLNNEQDFFFILIHKENEGIFHCRVIDFCMLCMLLCSDINGRKSIIFIISLWKITAVKQFWGFSFLIDSHISFLSLQHLLNFLCNASSILLLIPWLNKSFCFYTQ